MVANGSIDEAVVDWLFTPIDFIDLYAPEWASDAFGAYVNRWIDFANPAVP